MADTRAPSRHALLHDVLQAALTGGEADIVAALADLDESALGRLRDAMHRVSDLAEARRKQLWRSR